MQLAQKVTVYNIDTDEVILQRVKNRSLMIGHLVNVSETREIGEPHLPSFNKAKVLKLKPNQNKIQISDPVEGRATVRCEKVTAIYRDERNSDASDALTLSPEGMTLVQRNYQHPM